MQLRLLGDLVDVVGERERDDVGVEAVDDRARLLARAAVRLLDGDDVAGLRLPVRRERGVVLLVELARRVVRDVQQRHVRRVRGNGDDERRGGERRGSRKDRFTKAPKAQRRPRDERRILGTHRAWGQRTIRRMHMQEALIIPSDETKRYRANRRRRAARPGAAALLAQGATAAPKAAAKPAAKSASAAAVLKVAPVVYRERRLANGLQVITVENHASPTVSVQVWYHVGSRDDPPGRSGFAHLFEHMMFKSTTNLRAEQFDRLTEDVGGANNASTGDDVTDYHEVVPSNHLETLLWAEAERMMNLKVDEENFKSERAVVEEEYRQRVLASPYGRLFNAFSSALVPRASVQAAGHRQHRGPRGGDARRRRRLPHALLPARQRDADRRRRLRSRSSSTPGSTSTSAPMPKPGGADAARRRRASRRGTQRSRRRRHRPAGAAAGGRADLAGAAGDEPRRRGAAGRRRRARQRRVVAPATSRSSIASASRTQAGFSADLRVGPGLLVAYAIAAGGKTPADARRGAARRGRRASRSTPPSRGRARQGQDAARHAGAHVAPDAARPRLGDRRGARCSKATRRASTRDLDELQRVTAADVQRVLRKYVLGAHRGDDRLSPGRGREEMSLPSAASTGSRPLRRARARVAGALAIAQPYDDAAAAGRAAPAGDRRAERDEARQRPARDRRAARGHAAGQRRAGRARRRRSRSAALVGLASLSAALMTQGTAAPQRAAARRRRRGARRLARQRRRLEPVARLDDGDDAQARRRARAGRRGRARAGVRARRDRARAHADARCAEGRVREPGNARRAGRRAARLRRWRLRSSCAAARPTRCRASRATIWSRRTGAPSGPTTRC